MQKKVLIFYNSIGLGHKSIAENIGFYLSQAGYNVKLSDILKVQEGGLSRGGTKLYEFFLNHAPWMWHWLYTSKWFTSLTLPLRTKVAGRNSGHALEVIKEFQPDLVISTHSNSSGIVAYLKQKGLYSGLFGIAFSDFHLHRYWMYWQADFYLVNIPEQKEEMIELGTAAEKIFVCGMSLPPRENVDAEKIRQDLNINPGEKIVLISGGSLGWGLNKDLIMQLIDSPNVHVIIICGKNSLLYNDLRKLFADKATVLAYYTPMQQLYAIADLFITKPGGLSVSESLQWQLPVLVSHLMPGQEELNYTYLLDKGLVMPEPINLIEEAREELETGTFRKNLKENKVLKELFTDPKVLVGAVSKVLDS